MNGAVWDETAGQLSARCRVTVLDLPGHGGSGWDHGGGLADWAAACLDAAPERAVWIGWSLGAQVALRAALDAPGRVRGLLAVAGTPRFVRDADWTHAVEARTLEQFGRALRGNHRATLERFLLLQVRGSDEGKATLRSLRRRLAEAPEPHPGALEAGLDLLAGVDLRPELPRLAVPSRWVLGDRDTLAPAGAQADLRRLLPEAEVRVIQGAGHAPFLSHPVPFLAAVDSFLDGLEAP
jgi:pimeloyl-[acyl-carrier protein] methyl ester esterase